MNIRKYASLGLAVVLQVLPLTRVVVATTPAMGSSYAIIATWIAGVTALMGGIDAVSGASTTITSPTSATGTNGVAFSYRISTGPQAANTFAASPLPPGLIVSTTTGRITGTPTTTGVYLIGLTASDSGIANRTITTNLTLTIIAGGVSGGTAPSFTTQPTSQTVTAGANVNFNVTASGTAPLSYQWRLNGANISGATSATLALTSVTVGQSGGSYTCFVTNSAGNATSSAATLTVNPAIIAPAITTQPTSQAVTAGANVNFTVTASGTAPLSYQWRLNGANISGATSATLALTSVTVGQSGGSYTCFVTNSAGNATSSAATLTVNPAIIAPAITTQPTSQAVTAGANVNFTVTASGTAPLSYQWRLNGADIGGATSATLVLTSVTLGQSGGGYTCVVTNIAGSATSSAATLTVTASAIAPTITTQPVNQTVTGGNNASFTVAASGTAPLSYQWRLNGANIGGATNATLALSSVTVGQSGGGYSCVVTNIAESATSSAATLTVNAALIAPIITTQPLNRTVTAGTNVSFIVAATGTAPLSYQWRLNGADIGGATGTTLSLSSVTAGQSGGSYSCYVSNAAGTATSSAAVLTVNPAPVAPTITTQPISRTVTTGTNVSFTVTASGTSPFSYQWRFNGANISGATSAALTLTSLTTGNSGSYSCVVTNVGGSATSSAATLTVNAAVSQPTTLTLIIHGQGTVSPDLRSANLNIGQLYTVTATPAAGYVFTGWTVQSPSTVPSSRTIAFAMASNLVLQATFVPDPSVAAAGVYNGLFFENDVVRLHSAGQFNLALNSGENFSAWLQIGATRLPFSGTFDANLTATNVIVRSDGSPLTVELRVGQNGEAGQIFGRVTDGVWNSPLSGGRAATTSPLAGDYTVVIPGTSGNSALPAGDGYATLHVASDGLGTMIGILADGARFSQSAYVTEDGDWPLFASAYSGKGVIVSWIKFASLSTSDLNGTLVWIKQAGASPTSFPLGFTNSANTIGSIYIAPAASGKALNLSGAVINFSGGSLSANFNNVVSINAGSQVVNLSANEMVTTIMTAVGSFTGQVREPGTGALHMYGGVVLQKQNAGYGTMTGVPTGSRVIFAAP